MRSAHGERRAVRVQPLACGWPSRSRVGVRVARGRELCAHFGQSPWAGGWCVRRTTRRVLSLAGGGTSSAGHCRLPPPFCTRPSLQDRPTASGAARYAHMSLSFSAPSPWSTGSSPRDNSARCDTSRGLGARAGVAARARGLRAVSGSSARLRFSCAAGSSLFAEERDGGRYLEAVVTCFERGRRGGLVGLLCTDRCAGLSIESRCATRSCSQPCELTHHSRYALCAGAASFPSSCTPQRRPLLVPPRTFLACLLLWRAWRTCTRRFASSLQAAMCSQ